MDISDFLTDFELQVHDIKGRRVHAVAAHIGWLNWGEVGDESFSELLEHFKAKKIGELARPGDFYDFVTYRDHSRTYTDNEGVRRTEFPNSKVFYVRREEPLSDLVLIYLLEPTHFGEIYVDRIVALLKNLNVVRYQVIGAMGSPVPHTRPIRVSGRSSDSDMTEKLEQIGVRATLGGGQYEGPTSIFNAITSKLQTEGITTVSLIAHMPTYMSLEEPDNNGVYSVLNVLSKLEGIKIPLDRFESAGREQYDMVTKEVHQSRRLTALSKELESIYDQREEMTGEEATPLPPSIQKAIDEAFGKT